MPASSGFPGPGERTIAVGAAGEDLVDVSASFRWTLDLRA
jgi:hypothetical protein